MSAKKLLALWGLKWNPFTPELPGDALLVTAPIENFAWRVEQLVQEGGFALIYGESGTGKSVALRIVAGRLATLRDVVVGVVERPQSLEECQLEDLVRIEAQAIFCRVTNNRSTLQAFEDTDLYFMRLHRHQLVEAMGKGVDIFTRQTDDQIGVDMGMAVLT
mgnify:CR=1 FL=1